MTWVKKTVKDVADFHNNRRIPLSSIEREKRQGKYRYYGAQGVIDHLDEYIFDGEFVLVAEDGANLVTRKQPIAQIVEGQFWVNNHAHIVTAKEGETTNYFLNTVINSMNLTGYVTGAAQPKLSKKNLEVVELILPDLPTQKRVAGVLSAYDDLIENNRRRIALLEEAARLIYREWFVHFRFPNYESTKFENGLPVGWESSDLGTVAENLDRKRVPISVMEREKRQGKYPYHGAAGILDHIDGYLFEGRHLLMGEDGTVITPKGHPVLQLVEGRFWVSNHAHVLLGKSVSTEFLWLALNNYSVAGHVTGVAQPKINQKNMNRIPMLKPEKNVLEEFERLVGPITDEIFSLRKQNQSLTKARDLLLPRLMDGRIAV